MSLVSKYMLNIPEWEYVNLDAMSYSRVSKFMKGGIEAVLTPVEVSKSISFGSLVDVLITQPEEKFNDLYHVSEENITFSSKELEIVTKCYELSEHTTDYKQLDSLTISSLYDLLPKNYKITTREKRIAELLQTKYNYYVTTIGKTIISKDTFEDAKQCAVLLKNKLKSLVDPTHEIETFYQAKFLQNLDGIDYKCMFDVLIIDNADKIIYPIDIKTSYRDEKDFLNPYAYFNYYVQAEMYTDILTKVVENAPELSDYWIHNFQFLVINRVNKKPMFWTHNKHKGKEILPSYKEYAKRLLKILELNSNLPEMLNETRCKEILLK